MIEMGEVGDHSMVNWLYPRHSMDCRQRRLDKEGMKERAHFLNGLNSNEDGKGKGSPGFFGESLFVVKANPWLSHLNQRASAMKAMSSLELVYAP